MMLNRVAILLAALALTGCASMREGHYVTVAGSTKSSQVVAPDDLQTDQRVRVTMDTGKSYPGIVHHLVDDQLILWVPLDHREGFLEPSTLVAIDTRRIQEIAVRDDQSYRHGRYRHALAIASLIPLYYLAVGIIPPP